MRSNRTGTFWRHQHLVVSMRRTAKSPHCAGLERIDGYALVVLHNHPSGDPTPSRADIDMTRTIQETAKPLGIALHDHVIIGRHGHASLRGLKLI